MAVHYIKNLISLGENQRLDFKFGITDYQKIARTLAAFANTDGGTLLVGVRDDGSIAGVRSTEEYFMAEKAAKQFCRPKVSFTFREWNVDGKKVLEIKIPKGAQPPYLAPAKDGSWKAFIRVADQNLLASPVHMKVWKRMASPDATFIKYTDTEKWLLEYLEANGTIALTDFCRQSRTSRYKAENILANLIVMHILEMEVSEDQVLYKFTKDYGELPNS